MGTAAGRVNLVEKLFDQALKKKLSQLAKQYGPQQVFELWTQISKRNGGRDYFSGWRWTSDMTIRETFDSMEDYFNGLNQLLQKSRIRNTRRLKRCF